MNYMPLYSFLSEYTERNTNNEYRPVAVGRYGIRTRESIYSKELAKDYSKNKIIFKDTLTIGMGSVQIDIGILSTDETYSVSPAYHTYRINGINPNYLRYCLECRNQDMFVRYVKKGSRQGKTIDLNRWLTYEIPVYSKEQQEEIVERIDNIQDLIRASEMQLAKLDELVKARFVEMFGSLLDNEKGFEIVTIEDLCTLIKDGTHQTPTYTEDKNAGFKFLSSKDVMTQKICWEDIKYIPADLHEKLYATIQPKRNDILMSKNGVNYGVAAINDTDEVFDIYVSLALMRPRVDRVNPVYFRCAINSPDTKLQFDGSIKGIGVPNLHLGEIKKTKILLPPLSQQNEFVAFVEQTDKSKFAVRQSLEKLETLKKSLMQQYFG